MLHQMIGRASTRMSSIFPSASSALLVILSTWQSFWCTLYLFWGSAAALLLDMSSLSFAQEVFATAHSITVRLEGATLGSGILVHRDGNRYTVLTAWHVVQGQGPGEELSIITSDGMQHQLE